MFITIIISLYYNYYNSRVLKLNLYRLWQGSYYRYHNIVLRYITNTKSIMVNELMYFKDLISKPQEKRASEIVLEIQIIVIF